MSKITELATGHSSYSASVILLAGGAAVAQAHTACR
jgi:hypothetical protein